MKGVILLLALLAFPACQSTPDRRDLDDILREVYSAPKTHWLIPLPYTKDERNFNPLEWEAVQVAISESAKSRFYGGQIFLTSESQSRELQQATKMPKLRAAATVRGLAVEMLFYPPVEHSPFSGDLLKGTVGHRSSGKFLQGMVYDSAPNFAWPMHLISTSPEPISKRAVLRGLALEGARTRGELLADRDVFVFLHFYGHGIQSGHDETALVLPVHELSKSTYTGLSHESLITAKEALQTFLNVAVGLPADFVRETGRSTERVIASLDIDAIMRSKRPFSTRTRKLGIAIVLETCSNTRVQNAAGEKGSLTKFGIDTGQAQIEEIVKKEWLVPLENYIGVGIDVEIQLITVSDPGKTLSISMDYNKWDLGASVVLEGVEHGVVGADGKIRIVNPLNYGVLTPRIPLFLEESIFAASTAKVPYRFSDIANDIEYYKARYLSEHALYKSAYDEQFKTAPIKYWENLANRHLAKNKNDTSMIIFGGDYSAIHVEFSPNARIGPSKYRVTTTRRDAVQLNPENKVK